MLSSEASDSVEAEAEDETVFAPDTDVESVKLGGDCAKVGCIT